MRVRLLRRVCAAPLLAFLGACQTPDPQKELQILDLETYWAIDSMVGTTQYIAPVVRFRVRSRLTEPLRSVEATVAFKRKGEENLTWGTDWQRLTTPTKPLHPDQAVLVVMKSDARYHSQGSAEGMFGHAQFKDAKATVFLRVGASPWSQFAEVEVERRVGSRSVEDQAP